MTPWEERIGAESNPELIAEHVARYRFAAPWIQGAARWVDLGCGNARASALAITDAPRDLVFVDVSPDALEQAGREFGGRPLVECRDLTDADALTWLDDVLAASEGPTCITAFEVIEHLENFTPVFELLLRAASEHDCDVVFSVPNDAFWGTRNPFHATQFGSASIEELRSLLPPGTSYHVQYPLVGTYVGPADVSGVPALTIDAPAPDLVPSQFIIAFGRRTADAQGVAGVGVADSAARRSWERQREADLAFRTQQVSDLEFRLSELAAGGESA